MILFLLIASPIVIAFAALILAVAVARAPFGVEDDSGFHEQGNPGSPMGVVVAFANPSIYCETASARSGVWR